MASTCWKRDLQSQEAEGEKPHRQQRRSRCGNSGWAGVPGQGSLAGGGGSSLWEFQEMAEVGGPRHHQGQQGLRCLEPQTAADELGKEAFRWLANSGRIPHLTCSF